MEIQKQPGSRNRRGGNSGSSESGGNAPLTSPFPHFFLCWSSQVTPWLPVGACRSRKPEGEPRTSPLSRAASPRVREWADARFFLSEGYGWIAEVGNFGPEDQKKGSPRELESARERAEREELKKVTPQSCLWTPEPFPTYSHCSQCLWVELILSLYQRQQRTELTGEPCEASDWPQDGAYMGWIQIALQKLWRLKWHWDQNSEKEGWSLRREPHPINFLL